MTWEQLQEKLLPMAVNYGVRVLGVLVLLGVAWIAAGWVMKAVERAMNRAKIDATLTRFAAAFSRWLILLLAGLACLGVFGVQTTSFAAVIGATSLAIGLAFQGALSNFAAGIMLLVFRPFKVSDVITAAGQTGKVHAIELFTTTIDTFDNRRFIVPNSNVFGSVIENITHHSQRRADVDVGVSYSAEIDRTREVLLEAAKNVPGSLQIPEPAVVLRDLGPSSVDWSVRVWADSSDYGDVRQATIRAVKKALEAANIGIPFPQMKVHLEQPTRP